jgi:acetyl-CoA C-acetyltransferase
MPAPSRSSDPARTPVLVAAARTPIGRFLGGLASLKAPELGAVAIREALRRSGVANGDVQEVIMGHVVQGGTRPRSGPACTRASPR